MTTVVTSINFDNFSYVQREMVVPKDFVVSVNIGPISFQKKVEHVDLGLAITKLYF